MPSHSHTMIASQGDGTERTPSAGGTGQLLATGIGISQYQTPGAQTNLNDAVVAPAGGDQPHNNMQPYLTFNFNIALQGVYPPRS